MTFKVTYTGEMLVRNIFYSTKAAVERGDEFCKKMDALAKEIKQLKKEEENNLPIEEKQEEMVALVQKQFTQQGLEPTIQEGN